MLFGGLLAIGQPPAEASVTVGETFTVTSNLCVESNEPNDNNVYSVVFQTSTPSGAPSYVIPSDGVITSWSFRADGPPPINSAPSTRA